MRDRDRSVARLSQRHPNLGRHHQSLRRIQTLTHLLDNAIPLPGGYRVGLDPLLGLVPGAGDLVSTGLSAYIIWVAAQTGLPRSTLTRMVSNVALETVFGSVPVVGDLFDFTWKANLRNLDLLEEHLAQPRRAKAADRGFLVALLVILGLVAVVLVSGTLFLLSLFWRLITGG
ncbi:DUF4112 domain-containing protein [Leptolyngbya sp. FACHB-261]|uniref:DUF4112 domain-containing protein n=1 Tax=Leptolyngbya sp. FACHB-261 TaxID=2692806 RepID=UPI0016895193|nr:DUF4112 domain-containing protein [Leptolyngbya sp. FACHB-261]MBD2102103.1 DUF4112 domain-containing protein [Leptolyngbya sp. FACHB-261]